MSCPKTAAAIPADPDSLFDRADWSFTENSVSTNCDYTQYDPSSCGKSYGSLASADANSGELRDCDVEQPSAPYSDSLQSYSAINSSSPSKSSRTTDASSSYGVFVDESCDAHGTFQADYSSKLKLKAGTENTYYVLVRSHEEVSASNEAPCLVQRKNILQRARLTSSRLLGFRGDVGGSATDKRSLHDAGASSTSHVVRGHFFSRLKMTKGKFKPANKNDAPLEKETPTTPKPSTYFASMLTPTTSPLNADNVTPSGLNCVTPYTSSDAAPPEMPSRGNSVASESQWQPKAEEDHASLTDVTRASDSSRDVSSTNSPTKNNDRNGITSPICNASSGRMGKAQDIHSFNVGVKSAGNEVPGMIRPDDAASSVYTKRKNATDAVALVNVCDADSGKSKSSSEILKEEETSMDGKDDGFNVALFEERPDFGTLVVDYDTAIEMEHFEPPDLEKEDASPSVIATLVSPSQQADCEALRPSTVTVPLNIETRASKALVLTHARRQNNIFDLKANRTLTQNGTKDNDPKAKGKRSMPTRGLMRISTKSTRDRIKSVARRIRYEHLQSPRYTTENPNVKEKISNIPERASTKNVHCCKEVSLTYAADPQSETDKKYYGCKSIAVHNTIESTKVEKQTSKKEEDTVHGNFTPWNTNQPVELSRIISITNQYSTTIGSSIDDTVFNEMTLTTVTDLENSTMEEASVSDYEDDESVSSFTFRSNDSTHRSDGSEFVARCGIRPCF